MKRFIEILQNLEKHCKVLQKSRVGRTVIDGKMSFGGKLGLMLTLSWLVRVQFGTKRGKLMRFRGPKSVQEHAKSVPRAF